MRNYLAVDTGGNYLTVVASKNGRTFSSFIPNCAMKQSAMLMQVIDETLQKADLTPSECDFFASVVGAGSFTGIRIGISAIKGFCLAENKPSLAVTSFDVAAYNAIEPKQKVLCLVDALHDAYYAAGYCDGKCVYEPSYLTEAEVSALAAEGYALRACSALPLSEKASVQIVDPVIGLQNAVAALAEKNAFGALTALYVRKSSAELNLGK